jgi:dihydrofolate reductase
VLLGRATYEKCLQFPEWPYAGKPYWVFSKTNGNDPAAVVAEMKSRGLRRAWLVGGGKLAAAFRAAGLISEHIVSFVPVLLGAGIPLFDGPGDRERLRLISSRAYPSGLVQLRYARAV